MLTRADKAFYIFTEALKGTEEIMGTIGWAVCQKGDEEDEWYPISFGSRTIRNAELNYPIDTLEQLAVVEGYQKIIICLIAVNYISFATTNQVLTKPPKLKKR